MCVVNVGIEALVGARYELPAFSTLRRAAQKARAQVNQGYYQQVYDALDSLQRLGLTTIDLLLIHDPTCLPTCIARASATWYSRPIRMMRNAVLYSVFLRSLCTMFLALCHEKGIRDGPKATNVSSGGRSNAAGRSADAYWSARRSVRPVGQEIYCVYVGVVVSMPPSTASLAGIL